MDSGGHFADGAPDVDDLGNQYARLVDGPTSSMKQACARHGAEFLDTPPDSIVGVADNVQVGTYPLNGLRHRQGTTSGWFIWAGEHLSAEPDFFKPIHARHLADRCPEAVAMLGLGEGWRFLVAPDHEDAWFDGDLLSESV